MTIPITRPVLGDDELASVAAVLESGFLVQGARVAEFERLVAEHVGVAHAVAVSNCTAALRLALLALGIGSGDRVVVTAYSWVSTANVIELCGAIPVFVDIDPSTFNMSAQALRQQLAALEAAGDLGTVKAIMPVHTFGNPEGLTELAEIAAARTIPLIEDAACALGATERGRQAGSVGLISCLSFHPRKIITTGEGGMLLTDDDALAAFARTFRNHGQQPVDGVVEFVMAGDNLRLTDIQGAIGVVQMGRLEALIDARRRLAERFDDLLRPLGFEPQRRAPGAAVQAYVALAPAGAVAADIIAELRAQGIEATIGTNAIPFTKHFSEQYGLTASDLPDTALVGRRAITLPLFPQMTDDQQDTVVAALTQILHTVAL